MLAVAGWAYLRLTPNPVIAARFAQQFSVPVTPIGLGADEVARFNERQVVVEVYVPRGTATIRPEQIRAVLHLEGRVAGVYNIPVEVIAPKLEIKSLSPASVTLSIERIETRSIPVALFYSGLVRANVVVQRAAAQPATATLRAATSDLARVVGVRVDVPYPAAPTTYDAMLRPVAIDAHGLEMPNISVTPNLLRVRARFVAPQHRS